MDLFTAVNDHGPRVLSNRGANGIDGTVATAFGVAAHGPAVLLVGDVTLAHDIGSLLTARRYPELPLTVVLLDNGGGGIFDFLPVAEHAEPALFESQIVTPSGLTMATVAGLAGLRHVVASNAASVRAALDEPGLIEYRTDRVENVAKHRELFAAVAARL